VFSTFADPPRYLVAATAKKQAQVLAAAIGVDDGVALRDGLKALEHQTEAHFGLWGQRRGSGPLGKLDGDRIATR
jgi:hypothetical protein